LPGPVRMLALAELDGRTGTVAGALGGAGTGAGFGDGPASGDGAGPTVTAALAARPDEVWLLRPDAHVAAVLAAPSRDDVAAALARATARGTTAPPPRARTSNGPEEGHDGVLQASR
ncbi:hypothetical protein NH602_12955, partial [Pseudonocardia sp. McavD-2-B]|nr:hypothetical protein [Pseudonocardia sp. McavD-2-B]